MSVETSKIEPYEITIGSTALVLVDTPGFDDTNMSDFEILQTIATWLEATFEKGQLLSGVIYLHRITNTRVAGSARRALHVFQRICGEDNYKNVILATTFWNSIAHCEDIGVDREQQLLSNRFPVGADDVDLDVVAARPVTADHRRGRDALGG